MKLFQRKNKSYIVQIKSGKRIENVEVKAKNKNEAKEMVTDVLIKCNVFKFKSPNDFELKCIKKYWRD